MSILLYFTNPINITIFVAGTCQCLTHQCLKEVLLGGLKLCLLSAECLQCLQPLVVPLRPLNPYSGKNMRDFTRAMKNAS